MKPGKFSVDQGVLLNLLLLVVLVAGVFAFRGMPRDLFPDVSVESVTITTVMPGASPKEIEELITIPIEREVQRVEGVDETISTSSEGVSSIFLMFEPGIPDFFKKVTEVQNEVNQVRRLPEEAEKPVVTELKVSFETITVCVTGDAPEHDVKRFADDLEDALRDLSGVAEVEVSGLREREIWIECDPVKLQNYGLSLAAVADAIGRRSVNLPGGTLRMGESEVTVRTQAEFGEIGEIGDTVVREDPAGGHVYLRDVATFRDAFEERNTLARLDGAPSVTMLVKKDKKSNAIELVGRIRELVTKMGALAPAGVRLSFVDDRSIEIKDQIDSLSSNLLTGMCLVMLVLTFSIGFRPSLLVASGMVASLIATFVFMDVMDYSINMLTLFGLIMVLGMLCDDAIVVCENTYRLYEEGLPLKEAAIRGVDEIAWPVIASVSTTIAAFLPLLLMSGLLGKFMSVIPVVVSLALFASLLEALYILPGHVYEFGAPAKHEHKARKGPPRWIVAITRGYEWSVALALRLRYLVALAALGMAVFALWLATTMDFILFGGRDLLAFSLVVETPPGSTLEATERVLQEIEAEALALRGEAPEIENVRLAVGQTAGRGAPGPSDIAGSNAGEVRVDMVPLKYREKLGTEFREALRGRIGDVAGYKTLTFEDRTEGPPVGKAVQVRVRGDNFEVLRRIAEELKEFLSTVEGVTDITDSFPRGEDEVRPVLDLEKMAAMGLDVRTVAREVRGAFDGILATTVHDGDEDVDVMVKYDEASRRRIGSLEDMVFVTPAGLVPFGNFGRVERAPGVAHIGHYDGRRTINVLADVTEAETSEGRKMTSAVANRMLAERFADLEDRYPGYSLSFGGEFEDIQESLDSLLRATSVALVLIFMILGGVFRSFVQPFIVMVTVPLGFIGVVLGFYLMNEPLGMFAIVGLIGLAGIVVNNAIILIDFINERRRAGAGRRESILHAGSVRFRPIMLTTITTVLGLMPMTVNIFGVDPLMKPMALSISWGLAFATLLTLFVIPCVYAIFDDFYVRIMKRPLGLHRDEWAELQARRAAGEIPSGEDTVRTGPGGEAS